MIEKSSAVERLARIQQEVAVAARRYGRDPAGIGIVAVSKGRNAAQIRALATHGQRQFGENYMQEAQPKTSALADLPLVWHFIGALQANKTRAISARFHWVHTVDRIKIARRLAEQRPAGMGPLNILIQVNTSGEATKAGAEAEQVPALAEDIALLASIRLRGLMTLPEPQDDFETQRRPFRLLAKLQAELQRRGLPVDQLSMGMSNDFVAAIAEGATMVRIGTAIFGPRPQPPRR